MDIFSAAVEIEARLSELRAGRISKKSVEAIFVRSGLARTEQRIEIAYDRKGTFRIRSNSVGSIANLFEENTSLEFVGAPQVTDLLCVSQNLNSSGKTNQEFVLVREPFACGDLNLASRINGVVLCGPDLLLPSWKEHGLHNTKSVKLIGEKSEIEIGPIHSPLLSAVDQQAHRHEWLRTQSLVFRAKDGLAFSLMMLMKDLNLLLDFLSFVRGFRVGLSHLVGYDSLGGCKWVQLGSYKADSMQRQSNWFDCHLTRSLPSIFDLLTAYCQKTDNRKFIRKVVGYYCLGNSLRQHAVEPALVMSATALEVIASHIFPSGEFTRIKRTGFGNLVRALWLRLKISEAPDLGLKDLPKLVGTENWLDCFDGIAKLRNLVTHSKGEIPGGFALHEAQAASQWLVEVSLLAILGYRGEYGDRRISRWVGEHKLLPVQE